MLALQQSRRLFPVFTDRHDDQIGNKHCAGEKIDCADDAPAVGDETEEQWRNRAVEMKPDRAGPLRT